MKRAVVLLAVALMGARCQPSPTPPAVEDRCGEWCAKFADLKCPEAEPTAAGATCDQWCANAEANGIQTAGDPACVRSANTCDAVRSCPVER